MSTKTQEQGRTGYVSNIEHWRQEGDKPGKVGWGQTGEGIRCPVVLFGVFSVSSEDEDKGIYEEESDRMTAVL